jgi:hypothetical protein
MEMPAAKFVKTVVHDVSRKVADSRVSVRKSFTRRLRAELVDRPR